jgi:hypothetical protein
VRPRCGASINSEHTIHAEHSQIDGDVSAVELAIEHAGEGGEREREGGESERERVRECVQQAFK